MAFRKHMISHGPRTLCEGPETLRNSESISDGLTYQLTGVGARDACTSQNGSIK